MIFVYEMDCYNLLKRHGRKTWMRVISGLTLAENKDKMREINELIGRRNLFWEIKKKRRKEL